MECGDGLLMQITFGKILQDGTRSRISGRRGDETRRQDALNISLNSPFSPHSSLKNEEFEFLQASAAVRGLQSPALHAVIHHVLCCVLMELDR